MQCAAFRLFRLFWNGFRFRPVIAIVQCSCTIDAGVFRTRAQLILELECNSNHHQHIRL